MKFDQDGTVDLMIFLFPRCNLPASISLSLFMPWKKLGWRRPPEKGRGLPWNCEKGCIKRGIPGPGVRDSPTPPGEKLNGDGSLGKSPVAKGKGRGSLG